MSYIPKPDASGDTLSASRDPIRTNFTILKDRFDENHVNLDGGAGGGKHSFLQMPNQGSAPPTAASESGFYAAAVGGVSQLHFRGETTGSPYQLTVGTSGVDPAITEFGTNTAYVADHTGGWTFLPGGLIMQYGARSTPGESGVITFPRAFPTAYFVITLTMSRNASSSRQSVSVDNAVGTLAASFAYRSTSSNTDPIYWTAIGN